MKKLLLISVLLLTACAGQTSTQILSSAETAAWTGINALETINTATGGVFTDAAVDYALKQTHNTGDAAVVKATLAAANKVIAAQAAAHVASGAANQAIATAVLNDPNTVVAATNAAATVTN